MLVESGTWRAGGPQQNRPDRIGLIALLGADLQSGLGRGLILVAAPWWVMERSGQFPPAAVLALAIAVGWLLSGRRAFDGVRNLPARVVSGAADFSVALALWVVLLIDVPVVLQAIAAVPLAALQRRAGAARVHLVDPAAADAQLEPARVARRLRAIGRWSPLGGLLLAALAFALFGGTVAIWLCFGLFLQAGEFIFVAVRRTVAEAGAGDAAVPVGGRR